MGTGESSQRVSYDLITLQLFKNSIDTQEKLRLNLYSLSVSVSKLSEYRRYILVLDSQLVAMHDLMTTLISESSLTTCSSINTCPYISFKNYFNQISPK